MSDKRLWPTILALSLLVLVLLFVHACVPKPITDLQALNVSRVPASALPLGDDLRSRLMERGDRVWKVSLSGDAGWVAQVRQHELNSYPLVVSCDERDHTIFALGPYVGQVQVRYGGVGFEGYLPASRTVQ